jgi:1-acyl-sn-glycerol-3-phosphate acyltransferase
VQGGRSALKKGSWIIRPVTVRIRVGPPVESVGFQLPERDELIASVRREIEQLLHRPAPAV